MTFVTAARTGHDDRPEDPIHGFLEGPRPVFASYHAAARPARDVGYVICAPLGWEGIQCYRSVRLLAEALAAAGCHTIRVNYDGTGESLGSDRDADRVAAWLESVHRAALALRSIDEVERIGLIGMRLGATLAGHAAGDIPLASLVLWEPCVSGAHYCREMEIMASAVPTAVHEDRVSGSSHGIEAGGYLIGHDTIASLKILDLQKVAPRGHPDVLIICRDDRPPGFSTKLKQHFEGHGCRAVLEQLPGYREMMVAPEKAVPPDVILGRIRQWAMDGSQVRERGSGRAITLAESAIAGRTRRRPVRFGPSRRLFGVLTEPLEAGAASGSSRHSPVLLVTGGAVPRTSRNRMYIVLATRLAEMGHTVLRMDLSGIGESRAAEGLAPNDPYASSVLEDVGCAVQLLLTTCGHETISLLGLCSGAYATFQTALGDSRVRAAVLLNPEVFHLRDGSPRFSETELSLATGQYRQSLFSLPAWKKLLSGNANVRYIAMFASARLTRALTSLGDRAVAWIRRVPPGLAGDFHHLLARGVRLSVVFAQGDPGQDSFMQQVEPHLHPLERNGFRLKTVPGPDHAFNDSAVREHLLDWLVETLSEADR